MIGANAQMVVASTGEPGIGTAVGLAVGTLVITLSIIFIKVWLKKP